MVLPKDYEEEFDVRTEAGAYWGRVYSKMFCGDKAVFWRACQSQLNLLADELRITRSSLHLTSTMTGRQWTIASIDALRQWTIETDRWPVFDQPRTDPHEFSSDTGFQVRLQSHLVPADEYALHANPVMAAIAELRSGAACVTIRNLVTGAATDLLTEDDIVRWAIEHHRQLGQAVRKGVEQEQTTKPTDR